jgi:hypothetical protein
MAQNDIFQKLWTFFDILRDDGINYSESKREFFLLLFIKMEHKITTSSAGQYFMLCSLRVTTFLRELCVGNKAVRVGGR